MYSVFGWLRQAVVSGEVGVGSGGVQQEGSCAWLGQRYEKPEVCFVVGLVSFSGPAGAGEKQSRGHKGAAIPAFYCPSPKDFCLDGFLTFKSYHNNLNDPMLNIFKV